MCGIAGFWSFGETRGGLAKIAEHMAARIAHRGPDTQGVWSDDAAGVALAHRRLSIVDLSEAGSQPMVSPSGRYVLSYNGEIYNHLALRADLESDHGQKVWLGHSDTESLLACIEALGVQWALKRSVGMFSFALFDRERRELWLARDRLGEKPLYFGWQGSTFLFGSELKALRAHPEFSAEVDRSALSLFLRHNYVPEPYSIWTGIKKLPPGSWLKLGEGSRNPTPVPYWSLAEVAARGMSTPFHGSDADAVDTLEQILGSAVRQQMMADVPLGALLSGGIDSTLIAALMQAQSSRPVRTFTIGFHEKAFDEAGFAHQIAAHLGTEHTELYLSAKDAMDLVPRLPDIYDEPFADSSQLPTHLVMKLARQHVKVALSGDAGDEFFGGYNRYFLGPKVWSRIGWMPAQLRQVLGSALTAFPAATLNRVFAVPARIAGVSLPGDKAHKLGHRLRGLRNMDDMYISLVTEWPDAAGMVVNGEIPPNFLDSRDEWPVIQDPVSRMMALDALTYLPGDILTKVDRASMAVSLETRAPFLDRDVVEFSWTLPMHMKLRDGKGKWLLRSLLDRHVPRSLVERPKQGFGIPLDEWLRGPLRDWAEDLLSADRLRRDGYLHPEPIRHAWRLHVRNEASYGYRLWSVLMFQAWLQDQGSER